MPGSPLENRATCKKMILRDDDPVWGFRSASLEEEAHGFNAVAHEEWWYGLLGPAAGGVGFMLFLFWATAFYSAGWTATPHSMASCLYLILSVVLMCAGAQLILGSLRRRRALLRLVEAGAISDELKALVGDRRSEGGQKR